MKEKLYSYLPGILLFTIALIIAFATYKDYGISWDESTQWRLGTETYNYVFHGSQDLLSSNARYYGPAFELPLVIIEKALKLTDTREIFFMRHLVNHIVFLLSALCGYFLVLRLFKNRMLACLGFLMLLMEPRIYAHSYFNTKDATFLAIFLMALSLCQYAFSKNKSALIFILGLACGYTTSIRVMAVMLDTFIFLFLLYDLTTAYFNNGDTKKALINLILFSVGCSVMLYVSWPYLWKDPFNNLSIAYTTMSHYDWDASILFNGDLVKTTDLPWIYFPTWFIITNPVLWLIAGAGGILVIIRDFFKKPKQFFKNTTERNFILYLLCFGVPIIAVIKLNSVIYDDWRHLYFVYPSFVLIALYFINKILVSAKDIYKWIILSLCGLQLVIVGWFMVKSHPFQQVYFNELVSHDDEFLRKNYELEYWGCGFHQALDHLASLSKTDSIKVTCNYDDPLKYNMMLMKPEDRNRVEIFPVSQMSRSDYFVTNFRGHPEDYPGKNIEYSVKVLNSTVLCVFKLKKK